MSYDSNICDSLGINADQYGALKKAFSKYDKMKIGSISLNDFDLLSKDLGENFDDEELKIAKISLQDVSGNEIQFQSFLKWWNDDTN